MSKARKAAAARTNRTIGINNGGLESLERRLLMATFGVTTTADAGAGSLRQAILDANATPGADVIQFGIAGGGAQVISPVTPLPPLSDATGVTIDGTTAAGFAVGAPVIAIDGAGAGVGTNGLQLTGGNNVVQGIIVRNFDGDQIEISGGGNNTVRGSILTGTGADPSGDGVEVDSANNRIGGPNAPDRNIIGGNLSQAGVRVMANGDGTVIENNRVGTNAAGTAAAANGDGVVVEGAANVTILDNVISGNAGDGIQLTGAGATGGVILGNFIGTAADGTADLGNTGDGIAIGTGGTDNPSDNSIGATGAGDANTIAFNDGAGVFVNGAGDGNAILGNSIHSNGGLGIDLSPVGRTANDADDSDAGANALQNFPVLSQVINSGGNSQFTGSLTAAPGTPFRIEFFSNVGTDPAAAEGRTFLGAVDVSTNASGVATFNPTIGVAVSNGTLVTATATAAGGARNTSEFSDPVVVGIVGVDIQVTGNGTVITSGDDAPGAADATAFGTGTIGGTAINQTFTVTNAGGSILELTGPNPVTITGPGAAQFTVIDQPNTTIGAGQSATFTIAFAPTAAGTQAAEVSIGSNDPDENPFTFAINGQGANAAPAPEIEVSGNGNPIPDGDATVSTADLTNFGNGTINGAAVTRTFTIANTGTQTLTLGNVTISGTGVNAQQFAVATQPATSVAAGQTTTFTVRFAPVAGGPFNATVNIPNNDADENPYDFAIRGLAVAGAGGAPSAEVLAQQPPAAPGSSQYDFTVRYTDDQGISVGTLGSGDVVVTGPNGFNEAATFVSIASSTVAQVDVVYRMTAPGGTIDSADAGTYTVAQAAGEVLDTNGNAAPAGDIGTFALDVGGARTSLGEFGVIDGRRRSLRIVETDGTIVTLGLTNGSGEAFRTEDGRLDLEMNSSDGKFTASAKGGNRRIELNDAVVTGSLRTFSAKAADTTGVVRATQGLGVITIGGLTNATLSTPSAISSITINGDMNNSQVFSGANLGDDGRFGGAGTAADTFAAGSIGKFTANGSVTASLVAAGFDPADSQLLNGNGTVVGGSASTIGPIRVREDVDALTRFIAGAFTGKVRFGNVTIVPSADPRFATTG